MISFQISVLFFLALYIAAIHVKTKFSLLTLPSLIFELVSIVKLLVVLRRKPTQNQKPLHKRYLYHSGARLFGYAYLLGWTVFAESRASNDISFIPGLIPILIFSVYSVVADFFWSARKKFGELITLTYKTLRVVAFGQCVYLASSIIQLPDRTYDIFDFQDKLWTIQIAGLVLLPFLILFIIYYSYYLAKEYNRKNTTLDKRHFFSYSWLIVSSFSIYFVFFFSFKVKFQLFQSGSPFVEYLAICLGITALNLIMTSAGHKSLM